MMLNLPLPQLFPNILFVDDLQSRHAQIVRMIPSGTWLKRVNDVADGICELWAPPPPTYDWTAVCLGGFAVTPNSRTTLEQFGEALIGMPAECTPKALILHGLNYADMAYIGDILKEVLYVELAPFGEPKFKRILRGLGMQPKVD